MPKKRTTEPAPDPATDAMAEERSALRQVIRELSADIEEHGRWQKGSRGQQRLNPALAERRACIDSLRRITRQFPAEVPSDQKDEFGL